MLGRTSNPTASRHFGHKPFAAFSASSALHLEHVFAVAISIFSGDDSLLPLYKGKGCRNYKLLGNFLVIQASRLGRSLALRINSQALRVRSAEANRLSTLTPRTARG